MDPTVRDTQFLGLLHHGLHLGPDILILDGSDLLALVVSAAIATDKILKRGFDGGREIAKEVIDEDVLHEIRKEP